VPANHVRFLHPGSPTGNRPPGCPSNSSEIFPSQTVTFLPTVRSPNSFSGNIYKSPRKYCKQTTYAISKSFRFNTYKKQRGGVAPQLSAFLRSNVQRCNSFSVTSLAAPHLATSIESHAYKKHGGGGRLPPTIPILGRTPRLSTVFPVFRRSNVQTFKRSTRYLFTSLPHSVVSSLRHSGLQTFRPFDIRILWRGVGRRASGPSVRIGTDSSLEMTDHLSDRLRGTAEFQTRPMDLARKLG
jgi:hypothetical protein